MIETLEARQLMAITAPSQHFATAFSSSQIRVEWNDNSINEAGFEIFRKLGDNGTYQLVHTTTASVDEWIDSGLTPNTRYVYRVRAFNGIEFSLFSNEDGSTTFAAAPPTSPNNNDAAAISSSQIRVRWNDRSNNEQGFRVWRKLGDNGVYQMVHETTANVSEWIDSGLAANTRYVYRVQAFNANGVSSFSNQDGSTTFQSSSAAPTSPNNHFATAFSPTQIRVEWNDRSNNELGFRVFRKQGDNGVYQQVHETGANVEEWVDSGLNPSTRYVYKVLAFNANGVSAFSNEDGSTTFPGDVGGELGTNISWQQIASSPIKRAEANGAVVNGKLYVFGGLFFNGAIVATTRSDVYNPATNTWTRIADQPEPMTHSPAVVVGDTIWFIAGYVGNHPGPGTTHVWKYNTTTDTWSAGPDLPSARGAGGAGLIDNKIYFFGGMNQTRTEERGNLYVLDLANQGAGWQEKASLPNPRNHVAGIAVGGFLYAIGGQHGQEEEQVAQNDIHRYDPTTDTWTHVADLPTGRSHITAGVIEVQGKIIILGGETGDALNIRDVTMFDPSDNSITAMTQLPIKRSTVVGGVLPDGRIIFATGNAPAETAEAWIGTIS